MFINFLTVKTLLCSYFVYSIIMDLRTSILMNCVVFVRAVGTADARQARRAAAVTWRATAARSANTKTGRTIIVSVVRRCRHGNAVVAAAVNNRRNRRHRR